MSSVTSACDLTDVLKQGQSFLVMWISLLTRLESTVQHSNISLCGIQLMLFLWSLEKNKHNTKLLHASFMAKVFFTIVLHSPLPLTYSVGSIFHIFCTGIVIHWTTELEGTLSEW